MPPHPVYVVLGTEPRALCILARYSNRLKQQIIESYFKSSHLAYIFNWSVNSLYIKMLLKGMLIIAVIFVGVVVADSIIFCFFMLSYSYTFGCFVVLDRVYSFLDFLCSPVSHV